MYMVPLLAFVAFSSSTSATLAPYRPSATDLVAAYARANSFQMRARNATFNLTLRPHWTANGLWYVKAGPDGEREYVAVDGTSGAKRPLFDQAALAKALAGVTKTPVDPNKLDLAAMSISSDLETLRFRFAGVGYAYDPQTQSLVKADVPAGSPQPGRGRRRRPAARPFRGPNGDSPDKSKQVRIVDGQVEWRPAGKSWTKLTKEGSFESFTWSSDNDHLLAFRCLPGARKKVYLLHATGPDKTRATLEERLYDQPGDKLDTYETYALDTSSGSEAKVDIEPIDGDAYPYHSAPHARPWGSRLMLEYPERGDQEYKVVAIDPALARAQVLMDEKMPTFVDISRTVTAFLDKSNEFLFRSERDGWARLYLVDGATGAVKNAVTPTGCVFRKIIQVDEVSRQLWFSASGLNTGEDPYYIHYYRVNFDGTALLDLTPANGTHTIQISPDRRMFIDTYSRVNMAPIHELRRLSDGTKVADLEKADITQLLKNGVRLPEPFVAKGRDGKTDIYGVVIKPTNFDRRKRYPVIENIYAGPQGSFVPKAFAPFLNMSRLAELGFIVVQIDGMGTANRGKAFHDVCWHNIADAGFPDRILWMKALAKVMPQADISRVGVYGTSAGGQNACGAVLWHPEFYKAAVASCGCHDNRIDKQWWNEQWMGYPVGPWYAQQANANNVDKLTGHLFLFVAEDDHNVPPESTIRLLDAFIKANKDVEFLMIPGADHTDGGPYGEHKRRDFFVKWLLGVDPPPWQ
ncbi:MAG: prolyl oligopeptidase family serine peptidase [Fimbriimonadaceae bacterium]